MVIKNGSGNTPDNAPTNHTINPYIKPFRIPSPGIPLYSSA